MNKSDILSYVGNMQQIAFVRPLTYDEGQAKGLGAYHIKNGDLSLTLLRDKCLDISELSYKNVNLSFLSKPGLQHKGQNASEIGVRSIMGGFLFTAGLENICSPAVIDGKSYPMHGHIRSTPAEHLSNKAYWEGDEYVLEVSGEMREGELFGENLLLKRKVTTRFPGKSCTIEDVIENQAFRDEAFLILYHINFGYPFLNEHCEILIPSQSVTPRDEISKKHVDTWAQMEAPIPNEQEYVYIHTNAKKDENTSIVGIYNKEMKMGVSIEYDPSVLPYFMQWKTLSAGDYAIGLEPSNASVFGRAYHHEHDSFTKIGPLEKVTSTLKIEIIEGDEEYTSLKALIEKIAPRE